MTVTTPEENFEGQVLFWLKIIAVMCLGMMGGIFAIAVGIGDLRHALRI